MSKMRLQLAYRQLLRNKSIIVSALILFFMVLIYSSQHSFVLSSFQIRNLLNGGLPLLLATIGEGLVVLSGGLDLSVGAIISLTNVLAATMLTGRYPMDLGIIFALILVGGVVGAVNGIIINLGHLQPFVVTLATMFMIAGGNLLILPQPGGFIPDNFADLLSGTLAGKMPIAGLWVVLLIVIIVIFEKSKVYDDIRALGSDRERARLSGIKIRMVEIGTYALAGIFYALAGLFLSGRATGGDPSIGEPFLLLAFAAVVLGGIPFGGGRGKLIGCIFGAYILTILDSVMLSLRISSFMTEIVRGIILILTLATPAVRKGLVALLKDHWKQGNK